ncbi:pentatricopeptide repeat-containing protein [Striga asiatica]|uniref:Pentatricopeptide repeat-containing protein n=1 Tax=Striga asiatica TaxID=4170 RepID=A0A5A7P250_STRAF|nr:pentatricopeptide repeat-containing protein [Striga asiatica]
MPRPSALPAGYRAANPSAHLLSRALNLAPEHNHLLHTNNSTTDPIPDPSASLRPESLQNPYSLNKIISWCAGDGRLSTGIQLHGQAVRRGFVPNVHVATSLLNMYAKCAETPRAHQLFAEMPHRNAVTWNALISGYVRARDSSAAFALFVEMLREDMTVTPFGLSAVFVACAQLDNLVLGDQIHGLSLKSGLESNAVVGRSLIDMRAKCGDMEGSEKVFGKLFDKNVVAWTSIISGYALNGRSYEAMGLIREMFSSGVKANFVTYSSLLSSFHCKDDLIHCQQIHSRVIREGLEFNPHVSTTLLVVYSDCGCSLTELYRICSSVVIWDQVAYNAAIAGFANLAAAEVALTCFSRMRRFRVAVDFFTFSSVLKALANVSALQEGKQVHALISKTQFITNLYVQNGLVSMYAKCGEIGPAKNVFASIAWPDIVSWNSLLTGCAQHGFGYEVVQLFEKMRRSPVAPNPTTYLAALMGCSHAGLLEKGLEYFNMMEKDESFPPARLDHYACLVDLYGRAGLLHEGEAFINSMPIEKGPSVYKVLLSACQVHGNKDIAVRCARKIVELCPDDPSVYVLLANVLANEGSWSDAAQVRRMMCDKGVRKNPGFSRLSSSEMIKQEHY